MNQVGQINFDGYSFKIYNSLDEPLLLLSEVARISGRIKYEEGLLRSLEEDEYIKADVYIAGQKRRVYLITELGLYNILSQFDTAIARKWRRIVHSNIIMMRRQNKLTIDAQFDEWDAMADTLYIDMSTGILMQSITLPGGDVEQVPYEE